MPRVTPRGSGFTGQGGDLGLGVFLRLQVSLCVQVENHCGGDKDGEEVSRGTGGCLWVLQTWAEFLQSRSGTSVVLHTLL